MNNLVVVTAISFLLINNFEKNIVNKWTSMNWWILSASFFEVSLRSHMAKTSDLSLEA